jgi:hypothetical protein
MVRIVTDMITRYHGQAQSECEYFDSFSYTLMLIDRQDTLANTNVALVHPVSC